MKRNSIFIVMSLLLVSTAVADVSITILNVKTIGEKRIALFVSAVDEAGRPIKGLTKENFGLSIGGESISNFVLEPISAAQEPLSVVLGIDTSGSMKGKPFDETKKAISIFLDQLDKGDFVSLMSFGTGVKFLTDFSKERYKIREQLEFLRATDNWTHLYDATYSAIQKAKASPTTRTAVILLTDGRATGSQHKTRKESVDIATGASIPVFTIGFGREIDREYLEEIAQVSGGHFLFTPTAGEIPELYSKVLDQFKNQYLISFDLEREPGIYKAILSLNHRGRMAEAGKEFLFNPAGGPIRTELPPKIPIRLIVSGFLLLVIILLCFVYYLKRAIKEMGRWKEEVKGILVDIPPGGVSQDECQLEFPGETPTAVDFVNSIQGRKTKVSTSSQDIFLSVDRLKGQVVPLVYKGKEVITELIIARMDESSGSFKKEGAVYLWTPKTNRYISRPNESRHGHARIFLDEETERFAVEDLGSTKTIESGDGTIVGEKALKVREPILLQDGDIIDIGGREGIRIVYKERELGESRKEDEVDEGTITGKVGEEK